MESYNNGNNLCALKIKVRCGDGTCQEYSTDCKIIFKNYDDLNKYKDDPDYLTDIVVANGLVNSGDIVRIEIVRTVDVDEDNWRVCMNQHKPNGLTWENASIDDRMKFIAKYLNQHPYRTQIADPIYPCIS